MFQLREDHILLLEACIGGYSEVVEACVDVIEACVDIVEAFHYPHALFARGVPPIPRPPGNRLRVSHLSRLPIFGRSWPLHIRHRSTPGGYEEHLF